MQLTCLLSFIVLLPALVLPEVIPPQIAAHTPFVNCNEFFAKPGGIVTFPTIFNQNQYKQICQKYNNMYEFATLYNTDDKIPVYSAYLYRGNEVCDRKNTWYIEPQLDDPNGSPNMRPKRGVNGAGEHQALNTDYKNQTEYERGHLYPVFHTFQQCTVNATYTLTNAAPQDRSLNRGKWRVQVEGATKTFLDAHCFSGFAYVVTGVVPGIKKLKNRVIIPSFFWSAYCCLDKTSMKPTYSGGFITPNNNQRDIPKITVAQLDQTLSDQNHYNTTFSVFRNRC
ncbi:endonuclease domain-containing 1 protein-like [Paramormyrops kingsleyae]